MSEPLRAISLFSGAGGMDVGFENAGNGFDMAGGLRKDLDDLQTSLLTECPSDLADLIVERVLEFCVASHGSFRY